MTTGRVVSAGERGLPLGKNPGISQIFDFKKCLKPRGW